MKLPIDFENRMKQLLGDNYINYLQSFDAPNEKALQFHNRGLSNEFFEDNSNLQITKIESINNAYYYTDEKIGYHPYHHAGIIYSQDPAAMLPVGTFNINPNYKVLDLCAAPGGKTSQIASILEKGSGTLVSNEINPSRNKILTSNIERMGYKNVLITKQSAEELASNYPAYFDLVVVDAPCSGEGMFRKYPDSINEWSLDSVYLCQTRQQEILKYAIECLKPGGFLIYSTCTYAPEENENIVYHLINDYGFQILPIDKKYNFNLKNLISSSNNLSSENFVNSEFKNNFHITYNDFDFWNYCYRLYPHENQGEGQFFAHLQKPGNLSNNLSIKQLGKLKPISAQNKKLITETLKNSFPIDTLNLYEYGDLIYILPAHIDKIGLHGISQCYVIGGEIIKKRFIPHHNFFHTYGEDFQNKINFDISDPKLFAYLNGQEIIIDDCPNGYGVICINQVPIGGYKASNGKLKNHYPKALRNIQ